MSLDHVIHLYTLKHSCIPLYTFTYPCIPMYTLVYPCIPQPRSQGLSSLPPVVIGRKTLVVAGHVTPQNLGGKNIGWIGGVAEYFVCGCVKLCGSSSSR